MKKFAVLVGVFALLLVFAASVAALPGQLLRPNHLRGEVVSIDTASSTVTFLRLSGQTTTLTVTGDTVIRKNGHLTTFAQLDLADRGHAKYINNGTPNALKIFVRTPFTIGRVTGITTVSATTSDTVTLTRPRGASRTFKIDAGTKIRRGGVDIPLADLNIGDRAKIYYNKLESGEFVARRIRVAAANN